MVGRAARADAVAALAARLGWYQGAAQCSRNPADERRIMRDRDASEDRLVEAARSADRGSRGSRGDREAFLSTLLDAS